MSENDRWYAGGLRFACTGCGRCCRGDGGYVWVGLAEIEALARRFRVSLDDFGRRYLRRVGERYALVDRSGGDCVFLQGNACSVYEDRPVQCRAFPWWPEHLDSPRSWAAAARDCEGIADHQPLVGAETIEAARRSVRSGGRGRRGNGGGEAGDEAE